MMWPCKSPKWWSDLRSSLSCKMFVRYDPISFLSSFRPFKWFVWHEWVSWRRIHVVIPPLHEEAHWYWPQCQNMLYRLKSVPSGTKVDIIMSSDQLSSKQMRNWWYIHRGRCRCYQLKEAAGPERHRLHASTAYEIPIWWLHIRQVPTRRLLYWELTLVDPAEYEKLLCKNQRSSLPRSRQTCTVTDYPRFGSSSLEKQKTERSRDCFENSLLMSKLQAYRSSFLHRQVLPWAQNCCHYREH